MHACCLFVHLFCLLLALSARLKSLLLHKGKSQTQKGTANAITAHLKQSRCRVAGTSSRHLGNYLRYEFLCLLFSLCFQVCQQHCLECHRWSHFHLAESMYIESFLFSVWGLMERVSTPRTTWEASRRLSSLGRRTESNESLTSACSPFSTRIMLQLAIVKEIFYT